MLAVLHVVSDKITILGLSFCLSLIFSGISMDETCVELIAKKL